MATAKNLLDIEARIEKLIKAKPNRDTLTELQKARVDVTHHAAAVSEALVTRIDRYVRDARIALAQAEKAAAREQAAKDGIEDAAVQGPPGRLENFEARINRVAKLPASWESLRELDRLKDESVFLAEMFDKTRSRIASIRERKRRELPSTEPAGTTT